MALLLPVVSQIAMCLSGQCNSNRVACTNHTLQSSEVIECQSDEVQPDQVCTLVLSPAAQRLGNQNEQEGAAVSACYSIAVCLSQHHTG